MEYPEETITAGAKGKREARVLRSRGDDFVVYGYVAVESGKEEAKYSVLLRRGPDELEHIMIVPTSGGRELVVKHVVEKKPPTRWLYDPKEDKVSRF